MKKLWYSYTKELKLASKSFYFYVEFVMAFLIIFILLFMIPEEMSQYEDEYVSLDMPEQIEVYYRSRILANDVDGQVASTELKLGKEMLAVDLYTTEDTNLYIIPNQEDLIALTKADRPSVGALVSYDAEINDLHYHYYLQGYESERLKNLYLVVHNEDLEIMWDKAEILEVRALDTNAVVLNSRQMAVPSLLTFNGALMGMFIIAAYIFLDKGEGVIKAYAVTASKVWQYLMSKVLVMTTVTIITTTAIVVSVMGTRPNYPMMFVLLITSSFAASSLGLLIASFYDSMTKAFAVIYMLMMLLMLPAIAYFMPSWQPLWITLLPTHFLIQGFKEIVLGNGDMGYVSVASLVFLIAGMVMFLWSNSRFKKSLAA